VSKANHYRLKAAACARIAEDQAVAWEIRAQYRELARAWSECAAEADWIDEQVRKSRAG
jgi:hypothetical protein